MPFSGPPPDAPAELGDAPVSELDLPADLPGNLYASDEHEDDQAYPTESAFPPDPFSEPSPPHVPYPHPGYSSPSSPSSTRQETPKYPMGSPQLPDGPPPPSSMYMKFGTLIVIGAIAANVFGFRHSRWAVGKDIHRAWERHQRNANTRTAGAEAREARRRAKDAAARERRERMMREEERRKMKVEEMLRREREQREKTRGSYEGWEARFDRRGGEWDAKTLEDMLREMSGMMGGMGRARSGRGEFDARMMEEMMRQMGGMMGGMGMGRRVRVEFDAQRVEEMMNEFLRAAGQGRAQGQGRRHEEFDPFRFWERMEGARWRQAGGGGGEGVFGRAGMKRYYSVLGVDPGAGEDEVKRAYRKLVMKWHPDRYKGGDREEADRRFREITEAYEALIKK